MSRSHSLFAVALGLFVSAAALGSPVAPAQAETSKAPEVHEITLENGLRIFVLERSTSPTFSTLYQFGVGGASDPRGKSGIAHLLEHMLFKGTETVGTLDHDREAPIMRRLSELWRELQVELDRAEDPFLEGDEDKIARLRKEIETLTAEQKKLIVKNEFDELMTRAGGVGMNASTNHDVTRYYLSLPSNLLELWFRLESDRLLHPVFREFYSERDVVHEERRMRYENTASGTTYEAMRSLLFTAHPYGTPVIGWPRDIEGLMREDAMDYFKTYYSPSNCIMVLVGDVKTADVRRLAKKYFGAWERQVLPRLPITLEPEQRGELRRVVEFDAEPQLRMAWRGVPEGHADMYALDVLAMILGGLQSSRIDQSIVQAERIASNAGAGNLTMKYGGYFSVSGILRGEHTAAELEAAVEREIGRIQVDGVTSDELDRAKVRVESSRVRSLKSNRGQAWRIANSVFFSGGTDYMRLYERGIDAVTSDQVRDVATRYLIPQRKVLVEVRRVEEAGGARARGSGVAHKRGGTPGKRGAAHSSGFDAAMKMVRAAPPVELHVPKIGVDLQRVVLDSGPTVFIKRDSSAPSVDIGFAWLGGSNTLPVDQLAPFELASGLINQGGTESLTPAELEERKDELGMRFSVWVGTTRSGASFWSLERNFEQSFALALDVLMRPRLDPERLETLRGQHIESMRRREESPGRAASVLRRHVIYKDHPRLGRVTSRKEIETVTPEQVRNAWKRYLGRDNLYLTVVGDFEVDTMLRRLDRVFAGWRKAVDSGRKYITHEPILRPGLFVVEKDVPQPAVRIYHQIGVDRTAPLEDHAAIEVLNDILGGSGFRSRLMERLRSDEGLTYGIYSSLSHEGRPGVPGSLSVSYQTKQDSVARSIDSVLEELGRIIKDKVGEAEVQEQIEAWRNRFIFRYTNDFYTVSRLMYNELNDRPYDYDRVELDAVQKVTVKDIQRVARKYLAPGNITVAVYGSLTEADRNALSERFDLKVLDRAEVFAGGYDAPEAAPVPEQALAPLAAAE